MTFDDLPASQSGIPISRLQAMTESLVAGLERHGITINAHDPFVRQQEYPHAQIVRDLDIALRDADAAIIATKHAEYYKLDPEKLKTLMRTCIKY